MVQHVLLTLVAAPLIALGAPSRWSAGRLAGDTTAWMCRSSTRVTRVLAFPVVAWVISRVSCGRATSRRCSTWHSRRSADARPRARAVPGIGAPVLVAGRRPGCRRHGACRTRLGRSTCSSRCPRTRSWRWCCSRPRLCCTRTTRPSSAPGARPPSRIDRRRRPHHVARRRRHLPHRGPGDRVRLDAGRGATSRRSDRRAEAELADIRVRERLAERLAHERKDGQPGSGASR